MTLAAREEQAPTSVFDLPTLSSEQLYHFELDHLPQRLTGNDEQRLIEQARAGSPKARARLVEDCIRYIVALAHKFAFAYRCDAQDLIAQGNFIAAEHLDAALAADCEPPAYLRTKIHFGLINYCNATATLITTPRTNGRTKHHPIAVGSLDIAVNEDGDLFLSDTLSDERWYPNPNERVGQEPDYTALYEAIDTKLSMRQRDVVLRYYGLGGQPVQNLVEISTALYGEKLGKNGHRVRKSYAVDEAKATALKKLRLILKRADDNGVSRIEPSDKREASNTCAEQSSQTQRAHHPLPTREERTQQRITEREQRLSRAYGELVAEGIAISGDRLARRAHAGHDATRAWLRQRRAQEKPQCCQQSTSVSGERDHQTRESVVHHLLSTDESGVDQLSISPDGSQDDEDNNDCVPARLPILPYQPCGGAVVVLVAQPISQPQGVIAWQ